jgi:hypothetical protein
MPLATPTYADLVVQHGKEEAARIYRAETEARRARERAANAEIRASMLALGIAEDAAIIAANLLQAYPTAPDHGLGGMDDRLTAARVREAILAYEAALALSEAA